MAELVGGLVDDEPESPEEAPAVELDGVSAEVPTAARKRTWPTAPCPERAVGDSGADVGAAGEADVGTLAALVSGTAAAVRESEEGGDTAPPSSPTASGCPGAMWAGSGDEEFTTEIVAGDVSGAATGPAASEPVLAAGGGVAMRAPAGAPAASTAATAAAAAEASA